MDRILSFTSMEKQTTLRSWFVFQMRFDLNQLLFIVKLCCHVCLKKVYVIFFWFLKCQSIKTTKACETRSYSFILVLIFCFKLAPTNKEDQKCLKWNPFKDYVAIKWNAQYKWDKIWLYWTRTRQRLENETPPRKQNTILFLDK